jgi:hypothetical protein
VGISVSEAGQANQSQRPVHPRGFVAHQTACFQPKRRVCTHGTPRIERRILEDDDTGWIRAHDRATIRQQTARSWQVQAGDQAQQCRFAAAARAEQGHEFAWHDAKGHFVEHRQWYTMQIEAMADVQDLQGCPGGYGGAFLESGGYHCTNPFCHDSKRSRSRNSTVMSPVHISAITSSAAYMLA